MEQLHVSDNGRYLMKGEKPFFWLGDTAWLIFGNLTKEEAYIYLKNRKEKGFNVIQAVLIYSMEGMESINKMYWDVKNVHAKAYWEYVDEILDMAEELELYMALLPSWGSIVKNHIITDENILEYGKFLVERFGNRSNIIWVLGGDIKAIDPAKGTDYVELYSKLGTYLKEQTPEKLITFHPFGRCASTMWFADAKWIDFHMFQSGHRRYDQCNLGAWDDANNPSYYGEDSWKYVERDYQVMQKPTLDGEPSYEWILQGLHDKKEPYWTAKHVRRYAYWSVLQGACGHTYGDNAVMQFYKPEFEGVNYGVVCTWDEAIHHEGSAQMGHLKKLMESVDFVHGQAKDELLLSGQKEKHERVAVFAGEDFMIVYDYCGKEFTLDTGACIGKEMWWMSPVTGIRSYIGKCKSKVFKADKFARIESENTDRVLVIC